MLLAGPEPVANRRRLRLVESPNRACPDTYTPGTDRSTIEEAPWRQPSRFRVDPTVDPNPEG